MLRGGDETGIEHVGVGPLPVSSDASFSRPSMPTHFLPRGLTWAAP